MYKHLYIYLILLISNSNIDLVNCIYIYIRYIFCIHIYLLNRFMLTLKYVLDIYSYIYIWAGPNSIGSWDTRVVLTYHIYIRCSNGSGTRV